MADALLGDPIVGGNLGYHLIPLRDFLSANNKIPPEHAVKIESDFYKGGPPQWANFQIAENAGSAFVKRDGYSKIINLIQEDQKCHYTVTFANLFHQPGSGATTLAMQVLWDLRDKFMCAVLQRGTATQSIAQDVITISFYLGFNIKGPVACDIQYK
ncbi:sterile alpha motif domain-containing protein 9-like [Megalops cyprinoides]|uniref:sterile alpha motif domain-containing protein 9-like n=1 Tax=Megalops cyprinoides TaxID=118141 RepID=UPI001863AA2F|nr:sterile alpha motif domain-containing protein 9-like [Megalops cyprinoides]